MGKTILAYGLWPDDSDEWRLRDFKAALVDVANGEPVVIATPDVLKSNFRNVYICNECRVVDEEE